uniref:Uncharacterized protein n=1 Tax=Triticum urartu TaxID=4572 RepID=A0A8R7PV36_TRIUA
GDSSGAPGRRGEQPGVRGERARARPHLRLRRRHHVAAATGGVATDPARAGAGRDGQAQDGQRLRRHGTPQRRRWKQRQRLAVLHVVADQGHAGSSHGGRPVRRDGAG